MAERSGSSRSSGNRSGGSRSGSSGSNGRRKKGLSASQAVEAVRDDFPALLGRPVESVLGVERSEDSGWVVTVQVTELERIPRSTDVLGAYAVELDNDGEMVGYRRRRRYHRGQADED